MAKMNPGMSNSRSEIRVPFSNSVFEFHFHNLPSKEIGAVGVAILVYMGIYKLEEGSPRKLNKNRWTF